MVVHVGQLGDQLPKGLQVGASHLCVDAPKFAREVLDHAVGVRMIDVEAVQFAVGGKIHPSVTLGGEYDAGGVDEALLVWIGGEPIGNGVGSDGGDLNAWCAHKV